MLCLQNFFCFIELPVSHGGKTLIVKRRRGIDDKTTQKSLQLERVILFDIPKMLFSQFYDVPGKCFKANARQLADDFFKLRFMRRGVDVTFFRG